LAYLRVRDSHPPLDYLLRAPLARAGVSALAFRAPSALCSIGALALFAWWMRHRGLAGVVATGLLAFGAFQLVHGREARMYAELELYGVAAAVVGESWLRGPRRWHAPALAAIQLLGLLTHVSAIVVGAGLLTLAGARNDREAWRWRIALAAAFGGWAVLWGPAFLVQSSSGHSNWIRPTSLRGVTHTLGALVTNRPSLDVILLVAVAAGFIALWRADSTLGRVVAACVLVPTAFVVAAGAVEPVLLDRTLTAWSWGPAVALGYLTAAIARRSKVAGTVAIATLALVTVPAAVDVVTAPSPVDLAVRHIERIARPGDVIASHVGGRLPLLAWSLGVRHHRETISVPVRTPPDSRAFVLGDHAPSGRTWLLVSTAPPHDTAHARCASDWSIGSLRVLCLPNDVVLGQRNATRRRSRDQTPRSTPAITTTSVSTTKSARPGRLVGS